MEHENSSFPTSDFPLATYLYAKGIRLLEIKDSPNDIRKKIFVFQEPPAELLALFQSGKAEINVLAYNNAQNALRALLKEV